MDNNNQPTTEQLDPTVVNLSKAIRQVESGGNFRAVGDSGTSHGAYQWQPETWSAESKKYLGDTAPATPIDATPEQQNEVAYKTLSDWKKQGLTQAQSASKWNSGDSSGYLNPNQKNGNTPAYVQNVESVYGQLKGGQVSQQPQGTPIATQTPEEKSGSAGWLIPAILGATGIGALALAPETGGASLAGEAAVESALNAGEITGGAGAGGILSNIGSKALGFAKGLIPAGLVEGTNLVKDVIGGGANNKATEDVAGATEQAGQAQANATQNASEQQMLEQENLADSQKASQQIQSAISNSLGLTQTGRVLSQNPATPGGLNAMGNYGLAPDTSTGFDDYSSAFKKSNELKKELSNGVSEVLDQTGESAPAQEAIKNIRSGVEEFAPVREQQQQQAIVDKEMETYIEKYGDSNGNISLGNLERMKKEQGQAAGNWQLDGIQRGAHKSMYHGLRKTITEKTAHKDFYEKAMKEERKLFQADKIMKHRNGKKSLEHKGFTRGLLKTYGKYIGTAIGDKIGGVMGAVVGTMIGEHLTKAVDKRFGKTYFESKAGKKMLDILSSKSPAIEKEVLHEMKKWGIKYGKGFTMKNTGEKEEDAFSQALGRKLQERKQAQTRKQENIKTSHQAWQAKKGVDIQKQLPAPAIRLGAKTSKDETKVLQAKKNPVSMNPKTGKLQKTYSSEGTPVPRAELEKKMEGLFKGEAKKKSPKKKKGLVKRV